MVGGGAETKTIFHVTRGPASLPSFIYEVAAKVGAFVDEQSSQYAMTGEAPYPLTAPEGGREALRAAFVPLTLGSDHQIYSDSSWSIPSIYLNDWPDRFIHTTGDTAAKIDPTKLKRAGFIAAASGFTLANASAADAPAFLRVVEEGALRRAADVTAQHDLNRARFALWYEGQMLQSMSRFFAVPDAVRADGNAFLANLRHILGDPAPPPTPRGKVYRRNANVKGSLDAFGYDYLADHLGKERTRKLALSEDYAYEALNLVDGKRTTSEIRDALAAIYGEVSLENVESYLATLQEAGLVQ